MGQGKTVSLFYPCHSISLTLYCFFLNWSLCTIFRGSLFCWEAFVFPLYPIIVLCTSNGCQRRHSVCQKKVYIIFPTLLLPSPVRVPVFSQVSPQVRQSLNWVSTVLTYPPGSPDLARSDFSLVHLKMRLKTYYVDKIWRWWWCDSNSGEMATWLGQSLV